MAPWNLEAQGTTFQVTIESAGMSHNRVRSERQRAMPRSSVVWNVYAGWVLVRFAY